MVIIIDNKALEDVDNIIMSDDGHGLYPFLYILMNLKIGEQISIPVVLISEEDGDKLMKFLNSTDTTVARSVAL